MSTKKSSFSVNLIKHVHYLYGENCKTLMKVIKELNKCRRIQCSWIKGLKLFNCQLPQVCV